MENREFELLARQYMDMVFRLAFSYMKSASDADDVTQNVLLRLLRNAKPFESEEHARFWLVRVTVNECKRALRSPWRRAGDIEEYANELHFAHQRVDAGQQRYRVKTVQQLLDGFDVDIDGQLGGCGG